MENTSLMGSFIYPSLVVAVFVVGCTLLFSYIRKLFKIEHDAEEKNQSEQVSSTSERKKESSSGKPKKKQTWTRSDKQNFTSPWLLKTLKSHTGQVLNIDYSSSGKYLASCGEEDPDPDPDMNSSSGSESNKENSRPPSAGASPRTKGLSRRQRKNRKREESPPEKKKAKHVESPKKQTEVPEQYSKLNITEDQLASLLYHYTLTYEQRYAGGYPVERLDSPDLKKSIVYFNLSYVNRNNVVMQPRFDVNAREFVPRKKGGLKSYPSEGSVRSSDSTEFDSEESSEGSEPDYSRPSVQQSCVRNEVVQGVKGVHRTCIRCGQGFFVTKTEYLTQERCFYHWGKLHNVRGEPYNVKNYTCCKGDADSSGCTFCGLHVWSGSLPGMNGPLEGFVATRKKKYAPCRVYALDCEMCFTIDGLEVTKVTIVAIDGSLVYETFVLPDNRIIDYNTRFSGITKNDLNPTTAKSLKDVQKDLLKIITADTILIGHGLENDLRALKLVHDNVVDTAWCFPHYHGPPYKRSLKSLVSSLLRREVQCGPHDSYEDACACMELMLYKIRKEQRYLLRA